MITRIYMGVLATAFIIAILAGSYQDIPLWVVWLGGIALAALVGVLALTVLGRRILRGDFDPDHAQRTAAAASEQVDESIDSQPQRTPEQVPEHGVGEDEFEPGPRRLHAASSDQAQADNQDIHNNLSPSKANGLGGPDRTTE